MLIVKHRQLFPVKFSYSNIISAFDRSGELVHQQEGLGVNNEETVNKILTTLQ